MNIIWCVVDCLRHDALSLNNYPRPTSSPLDERLLNDFISFEDACTQSAFTLSVLSSLLTGTYPSTHNTLRFSDQLPKEIPTLSEMDGWEKTFHAIPAMNFIDDEWGLKRPFDSIHNLNSAKSKRECSQARADEVREKAEDVLRDTDDTAALLWFFDLHTPWLTERKFKGPNPARDHYDTELQFVSEQLEQLFQTLESRSDYEDSLVIVTGDHGELFREVDKLEGTVFPNIFSSLPGLSNLVGGDYQGHLGRPLPDELLHVPLYIKPPNTPNGGRRFYDQVEMIDLLPTILDIVGGEPAPSVEGESLMSMLHSGNGKDYVFSEMVANAGNGQFQIARSGQYKLTQHVPPSQITLDRPVIYAIRRWFTKSERFASRSNEREDLSIKSDEAECHREALRTWKGREIVTNLGNHNQTITDSQREELKSLGYL